MKTAQAKKAQVISIEGPKPINLYDNLELKWEKLYEKVGEARENLHAQEQAYKTIVCRDMIKASRDSGLMTEWEDRFTYSVEGWLEGHGSLTRAQFTVLKRIWSSRAENKTIPRALKTRPGKRDSKIQSADRLNWQTGKV